MPAAAWAAAPGPPRCSSRADPGSQRQRQCERAPPPRARRRLALAATLGGGGGGGGGSSCSAGGGGVAGVAGGAQQPVCIAQAPSQHNQSVAVWEVPDAPGFPDEVRGARALLLDHSGNLHSVYRPGRVLTGAYWDALALLPPLVPDGPLLILGLGAGTIAHLLHAFFPERHLYGLELDPAVVQMGLQHMGLQRLVDAGCLEVHVGDALDDGAAAGAGVAAGVLVDLFAGGMLVPQLTEASSWQSVRRRLAPGGRAMANLGAAPVPGLYGQAQVPGITATRAALAAMAEAFEGEVTYCSLVTGSSANLIAVSGPHITPAQLAQLEQWLPEELRPYTRSSWHAWNGSAPMI